jgi:hypothetical protein
MKKSFIFLFAIFVCALGSANAQSELNSETNSPAGANLSSDQGLTTADIAVRISEARRLLSSRPASDVSREVVRVAAFDTDASRTTVFSLPKTEFLKRDAVLFATAEAGRALRVQVVRANGVNTAVTITDTSTGRSLVPLLAEFPIVKGGALTEMAYYTSAHPALLSPSVTSAGKSYVRTMLEAAAERLAADGVTVPTDIVDIAEHLCIVEHTDHKRFMNEDHAVLFPEILSLYALNQGNTYRYSVSTAGAGGMIQMIPRTYEAIRQQHPGVSLQADFVKGMRDHANALEAMLLYMNDTWNNLAESTEVQNALSNGIATKPELMAAGYNSNPMRLPQYLKNGGAAWRGLIPAETQIYLRIYSSVDKTLDFGATSGKASAKARIAALVARPSSAATMISWLSRSLPMSGSYLRTLLL